MNEKYKFVYGGNEYNVDNTAYMDDSVTGVFFEVKHCPKCKYSNSLSTHNCHKCGTVLNEETVSIAYRIKRTGLGLWIGSGIWGVVVTAIGGMGKVRLGAIPTIIVLGGCMFIGNKIAGNKIVVDKIATDNYKKYKESMQLEESNKAVSDPETLSQYALVKICPHCGKRTEADSIFCSNCGKKI